MTSWGVPRRASRAAALAALWLACAPTARAEGVAPPPPLDPAMDALARMEAARLAQTYFFAQMQAGVHATMAGAGYHGGFGAHAAASVLGVGGSVAVRYERAPAGPVAGARRGVVVALAPELRPLALAGLRVHRYFDPYVALGAEVGGGQAGFRLSAYGAAGFDVGLFSSAWVHPVLTVQYQLRAVQTPSDFPRHQLHVGAAMRADF